MKDPTHGSAVTRWRARRLSERARAGLERPPVKDDGPAVLRSVVIGADPIRVLLFGSGPLVGYGVTARADAVDGPLANVVARRSARGAVVESRVRLGLPISEAVRSLGGAGTATYQVAVWAPRFGEELQHAHAEQSASALRAMFQEFREQSAVPLIACGLPQPLGHEWRTVLRRPRITAFNAVLAAEAAAAQQVSVVDTGSYYPMDPRRAPDAAWHSALAARIATAVLEAVSGSGAAAPARPRPAPFPSAPRA